MSHSTSHSGHAVAHDDHDHTPEEIQKHVRRYLLIGVALMVGTALTVWAAFIDFGRVLPGGEHVNWNVVVALIIACAKGFLVAGFFMHLISEKKMIYSVLVFTVFFFAALMYLTVWSMEHGNIVHIQ
jgi:cytochrome c oxidase subunit IV